MMIAGLQEWTLALVPACCFLDLARFRASAIAITGGTITNARNQNAPRKTGVSSTVMRSG